MFYIPIENYGRFEKKVNAIRNKGVDVHLEKGEPVVLAVADDGHAAPEVERGSHAWEVSPKHKFYPVEVSGKYEIPGWEFIGTVEHTPNGNIIRKVDYNAVVPERYETSTPECEHCHKIRDRKDTYLVRNMDTGEFKQVGRSCLKGYTDGLDAQAAAEFAQLVNDPEEFLGLPAGFGGGGNYMWSQTFKKVAYNYVRKHGYEREDRTWIDGLYDAYEEAKRGSSKADMASDAEIEKVDEWVLGLDVSRDYFRNAFLAWNLKDIEPRHIRLIASLINTYFKEQDKQKQIAARKAAEGTESSGFVGSIGSKVTFTVAATRVLYQKEFYYGYGRSDSTNVNRIVGTDGNVYVWATNIPFEEGNTITATVKEHNEYQGEKQTVITRGKVAGGSADEYKKLVKEFDRLDRDMQKSFGKGADDFNIWYNDVPANYASPDAVANAQKALDKLRAKYAELADADVQAAFEMLDEPEKVELPEE